MTYPARGWKPLTPWQIVARRGRGDAYVAAYYSASDYPAAILLRNAVWHSKRPYGVPPWDSIEVRERIGMPTRPKRAGLPIAKCAKSRRQKPNKACVPSGLLW